jgi:hypothetical protein
MKMKKYPLFMSSNGKINNHIYTNNIALQMHEF